MSEAPSPRLDSDASPGEVAQALRELTTRLEQLQAEVRRLNAPVLPSTNDDEAPQASHHWLTSLERPPRRRPLVPRLLLELLFLAAVAAGAALAKLDAPTIAAVMAGAWVLVALIEWAASRADRRRTEVELRAPSEPAAPLPADPSWFVPPVERTIVEGADQTGSITAVTRLPPAVPEAERTVEQPEG